MHHLLSAVPVTFNASQKTHINQEETTTESINMQQNLNPCQHMGPDKLWVFFPKFFLIFLEQATLMDWLLFAWVSMLALRENKGLNKAAPKWSCWHLWTTSHQYLVITLTNVLYPHSPEHTGRHRAWTHKKMHWSMSREEEFTLTPEVEE